MLASESAAREISEISNRMVLLLLWQFQTVLDHNLDCHPPQQGPVYTFPEFHPSCLNRAVEKALQATIKSAD
jgi:hypothetical protein